jgi:hypothetical protein
MKTNLKSEDEVKMKKQKIPDCSFLMIELADRLYHWRKAKA